MSNLLAFTAALSSAGTLTSTPRPTVLLGTVGTSSPAEADFTAFNALIAPRNLDVLLFMQNLDAEPVFYSAYQTWATDLTAMIMSTISPNTHTLGAFAAGTYDSSGLYSGTGLNGLAAECVTWGQPMIIRLAHEFNGNFGYAYGNTKETASQFIAGWQHIVTVFRNAGATNVQWLWNPNVWATANTGSVVNPITWYPGDSYVDIVALDGYQSVTDGSCLSPSAIFSSCFSTLAALAPSKPLAISEFGVAADSRLSTFGGKAGWYSQFFTMIASMPNCILVNEWQRNQPPNDYTISSSGTDAAAAAAFVTGVTAAPFV